MASTAPPRIFSGKRRAARRQRACILGERESAASWFLDEIVDDVGERLGFLRYRPANALVIGDRTGRLASELAGADVTEADPASVPQRVRLDEEKPYPAQGFDFIASLGTLDTVNDLPGALIHLRSALAPGGLMVASFAGAGSLPVLRSAMLVADGERPAARMHPMVDVRAGGQLLQRAGFARPVVDSQTLTVRYGSLDSLLADLRSQALGSVLASEAPIVTRRGLELAREAFIVHADADGRVTERFEILTLSGWRS